MPYHRESGDNPSSRASAQGDGGRGIRYAPGIVGLCLRPGRGRCRGWCLPSNGKSLTPDEHTCSHTSVCSGQPCGQWHPGYDAEEPWPRKTGGAQLGTHEGSFRLCASLDSLSWMGKVGGHHLQNQGDYRRPQCLCPSWDPALVLSMGWMLHTFVTNQ